MTRETAVGLVGFVMLASIGGVVANEALKDVEPETKPSMEAEAKAAKVAPEIEVAEKLVRRSSAQLAAEGVPLLAAVYERELSDGGTGLFALDRRVDAGEKWRPVSDSPCAKRPRGTLAALCLQRNPFTVTSDPGDETVMQPGMWVGTGCVPAPCAEFLGGQK